MVSMLRFLVAALVLSSPLCAAHLARQVTIYRDTYGVPHVFGKTDAAAMFGLMYAQAEDNFWQVETDYLHFLGRAAEVDGPRALANDILARAYEVEARAKAQYEHASPQQRALCDAFAAGLNYYLETHPQVQPRLIRHFEPWFVLADEHRGPAGPGITRAERARAFPALAGSSDMDEDGSADEGSNMWAIAPSRSSTGHAMLLINPHIGFFGADQRYEAHLHSDEGLDVAGFATLGTPYIRSGHNRYLGWSHTNNYARTADVYVESFDDPKDPLAYRYGGGHRRATEWREEIRIKTGTGSGMETRTVVFRKTHHGPVLGMRAAGGGASVGLAVRFAGIEGGAMWQRVEMNKARNLREFQAALGRLALTGSNTIYADQAGNIFYLHGNAIPRRSTKFDWTKPVDGSDPETEWQGKHPMADLPQVLNPPEGWLQNCNSTPFLTTGAGNPDRAKYPVYMAPEPDTERSKRSRAILSGSGRFTFDEWAKVALDTRMGLAEERIPGLQAAYDKLRESDPRRAAKLADLVAALAAWDQVGRIDSVGATLFVRMETRANELRRRGAGDPNLPIAALEQVKAALEADFGTWKVAWGEVNRMQRVHTSGTEEPFRDDKPSLPVPGAPSFTGTIFTFGARPAPGQKRWYGTVGNSFVAVVEFGKVPEARSLLVFGQSADPQSKHFFDQAELYSTQRFKPAWFDLAEIRKHLERAYRPGE
jgi:penicillin amidase